MLSMYDDSDSDSGVAVSHQETGDKSPCQDYFRNLPPSSGHSWEVLVNLRDIFTPSFLPDEVERLKIVKFYLFSS